ncbi:hypothetical protein ACFW42_10535 [Streptomyces albidoflavus]
MALTSARSTVAGQAQRARSR